MVIKKKIAGIVALVLGSIWLSASWLGNVQVIVAAIDAVRKPDNQTKFIDWLIKSPPWVPLLLTLAALVAIAVPTEFWRNVGIRLTGVGKEPQSTDHRRVAESRLPADRSNEDLSSRPTQTALEPEHQRRHGADSETAVCRTRIETASQQREAAIQQRDAVTQQRDAAIQQRDAAQNQRDDYKRQRDEYKQQRDDCKRRLDDAENLALEVMVSEESSRERPALTKLGSEARRKILFPDISGPALKELSALPDNEIWNRLGEENKAIYED